METETKELNNLNIEADTLVTEGNTLPAVQEKGLSRKEAVDNAVDMLNERDNRDPATGRFTEKEEKETRSKGRNKQEERASVTFQDGTVEDIDAPPSWDDNEKQAWKKGDKKSMRQAIDRVLLTRQQDMDRAKNEAQRYQHELTQERQKVGFLEPLMPAVKTYIESSALRGSDPQRAIIEALAFYNSAKTNHEQHVRDVLAAKGVNPQLVDQFIQQQRGSQPQSTNISNDPTVASLQQRLQAIESERQAALAQQQQVAQMQKAAGTFQQIFDHLKTHKTSNGVSKFLDLNESPESNQLAYKIGQRLGDKQWVAEINGRIPGIGLLDLVREAYTKEGGRIADDSSFSPRLPNRTQDQQLLKQRRAAASAPGRAPSSARGLEGNKKGSMSRADAVAAAIEELG